MQTSSQLRHPAPHSRLKEKDWEVKTLETVSPQFYELSEEANPNFSVSKTCLDCYQPLLIPETNPAHISNRCSKSFGQVGTMRNGLLSEHNSLGLSGEVKGSYSLPRPGALSKSSPACRPPGNTKSEAQAKKLGIIQKNEVFNPEWLEQQFGLPIGWTSPQELRAATELIVPVAPPSEISSTPELPRSHSSESCTSIPLVATAKESDEETGDHESIEKTCVKNQSSRNTETPGELIDEEPHNQSASKEKHEFLEDTNYSSRKNRRNRGEGSGCIYYRTVIKKGKEYRETYYQYELWSDGYVVVKSTKYIPKRLLSQVQQLDADKAPVSEILEVLGVMV
jgi:hypothetical protein